MYVIKESIDLPLPKFGVQIFNKKNPIAEKGYYKIYFDGTYLNDRNLYRLDYKNKFIGYCNNLQEAKKLAIKNC